jgi:hypothetical protein
MLPLSAFAPAPYLFLSFVFDSKTKSKFETLKQA